MTNFPEQFPVSIPNFDSRDERERLSRSAIEIFFNIVARWNLSQDEGRLLLGLDTIEACIELEQNPENEVLDADRLTRISYLIGIFKALNIYFSRPLADDWIRLANRDPIFAGNSPLAHMIAGGTPAFRTVRMLLDAYVQGY